jgi:hypothetical protein
LIQWLGLHRTINVVETRHWTLGLLYKDLDIALHGIV